MVDAQNPKEPKQSQNRPQKQPKKQKNEKRIPKTIPFKDHYCRINYLSQVSTFHLLRNNIPASRMANKTLRSVSQKTTTKILPHIKRSICKYCDVGLIPGVTSSIEANYEESQSDRVVVRCNVCTKQRSRFNVGETRDFVLYVDDADAVVDVS